MQCLLLHCDFLAWGAVVMLDWQPDRIQTVSFAGHAVTTYSYGDGRDTVLCLNGGPGLPCDYLRDSHAVLADHGFRVIAFDQLGTGRSDQPCDPALWTIERYVEEVEAVRDALGLGAVHLLGHSWGGWLAIEYAVHYPGRLKSLILENTCADIPLLVKELNCLRASLGAETVAMMRRYEAMEDWTHPEYLAAVTLLNYRHVCRMPEWPEPFRRSLDQTNDEIYRIMQGPNEYHYVGNLRHWRRIEELAGVRRPVLITVGQHDEITPTCALQMKTALPQAELRVFRNSSHVPFFEEPEAFFPVLIDFLRRCVSTREAAPGAQPVESLAADPR